MQAKFVIGVDEVGCGALAGPLVVVAVAFPAEAPRVETMWRGLRGDIVLSAGDSKRTKTPAQRAVLDAAIRDAATVTSIVEKSPAQIDERLLGAVLAEATARAVEECLAALETRASMLGQELHVGKEVLAVVDGDLHRPDARCLVRMLAGGDALDWRVGAASLVAKALHDRKIDALDQAYPSWKFASHRGYPTATHKALLQARGPMEGVHRMSFGPVREARGPIPGIES